MANNLIQDAKNIAQHITKNFKSSMGDVARDPLGVFEDGIYPGSNTFGQKIRVAYGALFHAGHEPLTERLVDLKNALLSPPTARETQEEVAGRNALLNVAGNGIAQARVAAANLIGGVTHVADHGGTPSTPVHPPLLATAITRNP